MKNKKYYVEEIWTELDYKEGFSERKITLPITNIENYKAMPWVKQYQLIELAKDNNNNNNNNNNISNKLYITPPIKNPNYNPTYFFDDQHKMIKENQITLNLVQYVKETWTELDYKTKKITEREVFFPIKNKEEYTPAIWVKQYSFADFLQINIDGNIQNYEIPNIEPKVFINKENQSSYLIKNKTNPTKRKVLNPFENKQIISKIASN